MAKKKSKKTSKASKRSSKKNSGANVGLDLRSQFEGAVKDFRNQLGDLESKLEKSLKEIAKQGSKTQKEFTKRWKKAQKDFKKADLLDKLKGFELYETLTGFDTKKTTQRIQRQANSTWKNGVEGIQAVLDLPGREEMDSLTKKVDQLTRKVRTLENRGASA